MNIDVCRACINEWAEKNNVPDWRWNHTVFDDSFWENGVIHCPVLNNCRPEAFSFGEGVPNVCNFKEKHA
jgi:hypothetical protein